MNALEPTYKLMEYTDARSTALAMPEILLEILAHIPGDCSAYRGAGLVSRAWNTVVRKSFPRNESLHSADCWLSQLYRDREESLLTPTTMCVRICGDSSQKHISSCRYMLAMREDPTMLVVPGVLLDAMAMRYSLAHGLISVDDYFDYAARNLVWTPAVEAMIDTLEPGDRLPARWYHIEFVEYVLKHNLAGRVTLTGVDYLAAHIKTLKQYTRYAPIWAHSTKVKRDMLAIFKRARVKSRHLPAMREYELMCRHISAEIASD